MGEGARPLTPSLSRPTGEGARPLTPSLSRPTGEGARPLTPSLSRPTGEGARRAGEGHIAVHTAALASALWLLSSAAQAQVLGCDEFANRYACRLFTAEPATVYTSNRGATLEAQCESDLPHVRGVGGGASLWWVWQPPEPGLAVVSTVDSDFDTLLGVYSGKDLCGFDLVAHNDDEAPGILTSRVVFDADPAEDYQIVVDGKRGLTGDFGLHIRLYTCPEIIAQPQSQAVAEHGPVEFVVDAWGANPMTYQWEHRAPGTGTAFVPLTGETNPSLRFNASSDQAGEYRVVLDNAYCTVTSAAARLEIQSTPVISLPPAGGTNLACETRCFTVVATGGLPTTNRWQFRPRPGAEWQEVTAELSASGTSTLCLADLSTDQAGEYRVIVSNAAGEVTSAEVALQVVPRGPEIIRDPASALGFEFEDVILDVGYRGPVCELTTFHWLTRSTNSAPDSARPFVATDSPQLHLAGILPDHAGYYSVVVSNRYGATAPSREALLTVARRPPNDHFANRVPILAAPATEFGANRHATAEPDEPGHAGSAAQHSVWWSYRPPRLGVVTIRLVGSTLTPRLAVYTGPGLDQLVPVTSGAERTAFLVVPGQEYHLAVDGADGAEGDITLHLELSDGSCPEWRTEPSDLQEIGDLAGGAGCRTRTLSGEAVGLTPVTYQWLFQGQPILGATNGTLRLENLTTQHAGEYQLVARNLACVVTSRVARVEVRLGPRILRDPAVIAGPLPLCTNRLELEVAAEACRLPLTYQWRYEGVAIPGATNASWVIPSLDPFTAGAYDVVVRNPLGVAVSRVAVFEVDPTPAVAMLPERVAHPLCSEVLLQLATGDCPEVTYQWRRNGAPLTGANQPRLLLPRLSPADVGDYDVVLAFGATTLTSRVSQVRLLTPPLRREPDLAYYALCSSVRLSLDSDNCGGTARYQWRRNEVPVPGATNAALMIEALTPAQAGRYELEVAFGANTITSAVAEVTVAGVPVITRQPSAVTVTNCGPAEFCLEVAPFPCAPPRYQWFRGPTAASATNLLVGATSPCLELDRVAPEDAGIYVVEVRTLFATNSSAPAALTVLTAPRITLQPSPAFHRVRVGESFTNAVAAESCPSNLTYRWLRDGAPVTLDANHVLQPDGWLVVRNATTQDSGVYQCVVDNGLATATTGPVTIRVVVPPLNDDFANRIRLSGTSVTATTYPDGTRYHNELATAEPGEPGLPGHPPSRTVWWTWTAPTPGRVTLDLSGSVSLSGGNLDTLVGVYEGDAVQALRLVAHDDNGAANGLASRVTFLAARGRTFHFAVDGKAGSEGDLELQLVEQEIISPPVILEHPSSVAVNPGETATFAVVAEGSPDLLYQWYREGTAIPNATNATLVLANVQPADETSYRVQIRNEYPPATNSLSARLTFGTIIRGHVTDATNGRPIPGATVSAGGLSTMSDPNGNYELIGVEPGRLRADFDAESKRGDQVVVGLLDQVQFVDRSTLTAVTLYAEKRPEFIDFADNQFEPVPGRAITNEIPMSPVLTGTRFVLDWGEEPADLDLVLLVRSPDGYWQVDYLWVGQRGSNTPPHVTFDVDARRGFGPETITLHRLLPATYQLYVRKFSERARGALSTSRASVRVYESDPLTGANRLIGLREVPTDGAGNYWHVGDLDGESRVVRWRNQLVSAPPGPGRVLGSSSARNRQLSTTGDDGVGSIRRQPALHSSGLAGVEYQWHLGDGVVVTGETEPALAYTLPGCKDIELHLRHPTATNTTESVTNKLCFVLVTNGPPVVAFTSPTSGRLSRAGDPIHLELEATDTDRNPAARQITSVELFRVASGQTNLVARLLTAPYAWSDTATAIPGPYVFIARATDNHGAIAWSAPVTVQVLELSGEVLIIRNGDHPETDALLTLLGRPSLPRLRTDPGELITDLQVPEVRVLDQAGLHFDLVRDFRLIVWDDAGLAAPGLQPTTVHVLHEAWQHGIPLYLIGRHLASAPNRFTGPEAARATVAWRELARLVPDPGEAELCDAELQPPESLFNELFRTSWHGDVLPFRLPQPVERARALTDAREFSGCDPAQPQSACLSDTEVRLACGTVPLLVRTPRIGQESALRPLRLSQTFLVWGEDDDVARQQRGTLFLNGVLWLLRNSCAQRGPTLEVADGLPALQHRTCDTFTLRASLSHHAECDEPGVLVRAAVPDGLLLCDVRLDPEPTAGVPAILHEGRTVQFDFGLLRNGTQVIELTLRACAPGTFTNRFELASANRPLTVAEQLIVVDGAPCAGCASPALDVMLAGDALEIRLDQPPGCPIRLEVSDDLRTWQPVPDGPSPGVWRIPVANTAGRFFRLGAVLSP